MIHDMAIVLNMYMGGWSKEYGTYKKNQGNAKFLNF
jgi:hypothetical protein